MLRSALVTTAAGDLLCEDAGGRPVPRVGFEPEPWSWTPWQYAEHGRFSGRWDDPDGIWRSIYVGESRLACFLEVLAFARPDPQLQDELAGVDEADEDAVAYPTLAGGLLPESWRSPHSVGTARLTGWYAVPGDKESLPTLRARFLALAITLRLPDVDAGVIRLAEPREFTQVVAAWLYDQTAPDRAPSLASSSPRGTATTSPSGRFSKDSQARTCRRSCKSRSLSRSTRMITSCTTLCGSTVWNGHRAAECGRPGLVRPDVRASVERDRARVRDREA